MTGAHTTWTCEYHIVWVPKYRLPIINDQLRHVIHSVAANVLPRWGCRLRQINCRADHVHLAVMIPPSVAACKIVELMKSTSAYHIMRRYPFLRTKLRKGVVWARGYYISSLGFDRHAVESYVKHNN